MGSSVLWTANVDGNTDIYLHDLAWEDYRLPLPKGVNATGRSRSPFSRDGSRMLYYHYGPNVPGRPLGIHDLPAANRSS